MGIERLMLVLKNQEKELPEAETCDLYIAALGNAAQIKTAEMLSLLRADGFKAETDICGRGLKAQMKYANKIGAKFSMVLGDNEIMEGMGTIKNMSNGEEISVSLDKISDEFSSIVNAAALNSLIESIN